MNLSIWTLSWIFILFYCVRAELSIAEIQATGRVLFRALRDSDCKIKCSNKQRRPVCGSDGITYASKCDLTKAKRCEKRQVSIQKKGKCSGSKSSTKCQQERTEAQKIARRPTAGIFIPECKKDGSYVDVQCHAATNYCWCVTKEGKPISGTSLQGKKPSCKGKSRTKKSFRNKDRSRKKKACRKSDRAEFNKNLMQTFIKEYERAKSLTTGSKTEDSLNNSDNSREKRVAEWKFSELDRNKDNKLRRKEVRSLKKMVKKVIKPRACAKTFISYCDYDQNKRIEKGEWTSCLGVDLNESKTSLIDLSRKPWPPKGLIPHQPSNTPPPDTDDKTKSCIEEREAALIQNRQDPTGGTFIPSCTNTGLWSQAQCHNSSGYCWCVKESTGDPIRGTSALKQLPKCNEIKIEREMKGCPFSKKRRFIANLLQYIIKQMNESNPLNVLKVGGVNTTPDGAVEWKFRKLDSNSNLVLERKELKTLRKQIPQTKDTRRCRRNFIRYCDENKDRKVSKKEWIGCMDTSGSSGLFTEDPRRRGPNPFSNILRQS
ncbi:SPARC-related modular calcium-binding protein 1-like isoform X5 [Mytilus californianus]|uniref:SPARC-related modular calcium-binding protein 1-like isoform X5 n=1 Tax=Mytilus californianus TaxID=6549 RepID=UPI002245AFF0|nr:SPARC-related modular calcium-binding protein 1-like isoform X5 [Mytilus californianus]